MAKLISISLIKNINDVFAKGTMGKRKLGLLFEYQKLPELFDSWNVNDTAGTKNAVIE
jgi:hypothetical protein